MPPIEVSDGLASGRKYAEQSYCDHDHASDGYDPHFSTPIARLRPPAHGRFLAMKQSASDERTPKRPSQKEQSSRFKKTARELGCDETPGALDRAFGKIEPTRPKAARNQNP
jgi:hypothetical protein